MAGATLTHHARRCWLLLIRRGEHPERGRWALPGGLLRADEDLDACAQRVASAKAGMERVALRQFLAFGAPARDPRLRVVSIGYLGLVTPEPLVAAAGAPERLDGRVRWVGERPTLRDRATRHLHLAFDHGAIAEAALLRLRADLDRTTDVFALLPPEFTLRALQAVHEAIRGGPVNKPGFRKRMLDSGRLAPTGRKDLGGRFRPAELYRLREGAA